MSDDPFKQFYSPTTKLRLYVVGKDPLVTKLQQYFELIIDGDECGGEWRDIPLYCEESSRE